MITKTVQISREHYTRPEMIQGDSDDRSLIPRWLIVMLLLVGSLVVHEFVQRQAPPPRVVESVLERSIPFVPWAIWIYGSFFPFVGLALWRADRGLFRQMVQSLVVASVLVWGTILLWPLTFQRPEPASIDSAFYRAVFTMIHEVDPAHICFPSLHVAAIWICCLSLRGCGGNRGRTLLAIGISLSTLLVKQHLLVDVVAGVALAAVMVWVQSRFSTR